MKFYGLLHNWAENSEDSQGAKPISGAVGRKGECQPVAHQLDRSAGYRPSFSLEVFFNIADALEIDPADLINALVCPDKVLRNNQKG